MLVSVEWFGSVCWVCVWYDLNVVNSVVNICMCWMLIFIWWVLWVWEKLLWVGFWCSELGFNCLIVIRKLNVSRERLCLRFLWSKVSWCFGLWSVCLLKVDIWWSGVLWFVVVVWWCSWVCLIC